VSFDIIVESGIKHVCFSVDEDKALNMLFVFQLMKTNH
jgi:hypothetical protein